MTSASAFVTLSSSTRSASRRASEKPKEASSSTGERSARRRARPPRPGESRSSLARWTFSRAEAVRWSSTRRIPFFWSASATNSSVKSLARWVRMVAGILSRRAPRGEVTTGRRYLTIPRDRAVVRWLSRPGRTRPRPRPRRRPRRSAPPPGGTPASRPAPPCTPGSGPRPRRSGAGRAPRRSGRRPCRRTRRWASEVGAGPGRKGSRAPLLLPGSPLPGRRSHVPPEPVGLPVVEPDGPPQHLQRLLVLEGLVVLEEALELAHPVGGHLRDVGDVRVLRVVGGDGDQLVVLSLVVPHPHHADDLGLHDGERDDVLLAVDQDVERVPVVAVGAGHEPVVGRVVDRAEEDAVDAEQAARLVQLVLHLRSGGDLDDGRDGLLHVPGEDHVVPGVEGHSDLRAARGWSGQPRSTGASCVTLLPGGTAWVSHT